MSRFRHKVRGKLRLWSKDEHRLWRIHGWEGQCALQSDCAVECRSALRVTSLLVQLWGHGKMSVAVRACACNERGSACMCVEYAGSFIYHYKIDGSTRLMAAFYSKE